MSPQWLRIFRQLQFTLLVPLLLSASASASPARERTSQDLGSANEVDETTVFWTEDFEDGALDWTWINALDEEEPNLIHRIDEETGRTYWFNQAGEYTQGPQLVWLKTPAIHLIGTDSPEATFDFRFGTWHTLGEGCAIWVFYGPDMEHLEGEPVPVENYPYASYPIDAFVDVFNLPYSDGWPAVEAEWQEGRVDLSPYTEHAVVQLAFITAVLDGHNDYIGFYLDSLDVHDGELTLFEDNADDPENTELYAEAGSPWMLDRQLFISEVEDAPTPSHAFGTASTARGYWEVLESSEFTLHPAGFGEFDHITFDLNVDASTTGDTIKWGAEIWNAQRNQWRPANDITYSPRNAEMSWPLQTNGWVDLQETYGSRLKYCINLSSLGEGVTKLRLWVHVPATLPEDSFHHIWFDNISYVLDYPTLDVVTGDAIFYRPWAVGVPMTGIAAFWNSLPEPVPLPGISWTNGMQTLEGVMTGDDVLPSLGDLRFFLDGNPQDETHGWQVPQPGNYPISIWHDLTPDYFYENDTLSGSIDVQPASIWELGFDDNINDRGHTQSGWAEGTGLLIHMNPENLNEIVGECYYQLNGFWMPLFWDEGFGNGDGTAQCEFGIFAAGEPPFELIYSSGVLDLVHSGEDNWEEVVHTIPFESRPLIEPGQDYYIYYKPLTYNYGGYEQWPYGPSGRFEQESLSMVMDFYQNSYTYSFESESILSTHQVAHKFHALATPLGYLCFDPVSPTLQSYPVTITGIQQNGMPVEGVWEVGLFDGSLCVGSGVYNSITLAELIGYGGTHGSGYTVGHPIEFKVYNVETGDVYNALIDGLDSGDGSFGSGTGLVASLQLQPHEEIQLALEPSFNHLISFQVWPEGPADLSPFEVMENVVAVYANDGGLYVPGTINTLGPLELSEGYRVIVSEPTTSTYSGASVSPARSYTLETGRWNWVGHPYLHPTSVVEAFAPISDRVEIVLSAEGGFYIPEWEVNTLGALEPGLGYMVFSSEDIRFSYPEAIGKSVPAPLALTAPENAPSPTGLPYVVLLNLSSDLLDQDPRIIEIYDGTRLVGKGFVRPDADHSAVTTWERAPALDLPGFEPGNPMDIRFLDSEGNSLDAPLQGNKPAFGSGGYALVNYGADSGLPMIFGLSPATPNPFNPTTTITLEVPSAAKVEVELFNLLGQRVAQLASQKFEAGWHPLTVDGSQLASGVYLVRARMPGQAVQVQKVVLLK